MDLRKALDSFYYSTALCDLRMLNKKYVSETITYNSLLYLEIIYTLNGKCTASKLAEMLHISKPGVTLKINELIKQGLVTKVPDCIDKRKSYLFVNEEAIPRYKVFREQDDEIINKITNRYTKDEIEKFCEMLNIITEINFDENNGLNNLSIKEEKLNE